MAGRRPCARIRVALAEVEDGTVRWSVDPTAGRRTTRLLTGSSSIYHALRCGVACAEVLGQERPDWELAAGRIAHAIALQPACASSRKKNSQWTGTTRSSPARSKARRPT